MEWRRRRKISTRRKPKPRRRAKGSSLRKRRTTTPSVGRRRSWTIWRPGSPSRIVSWRRGSPPGWRWRRRRPRGQFPQSRTTNSKTSRAAASWRGPPRRRLRRVPKTESGLCQALTTALATSKKKSLISREKPSRIGRRWPRLRGITRRQRRGSEATENREKRTPVFREAAANRRKRTFRSRRRRNNLPEKWKVQSPPPPQGRNCTSTTSRRGGWTPRALKD
mmetsp:Transcript_58669/g.124520  ORF Transcript_58669/g.124520 Transcript_58669/m.124520 type:complete len:222 (+) Transcript_58669:945-1610(+)